MIHHVEVHHLPEPLGGGGFHVGGGLGRILREDQAGLHQIPAVGHGAEEAQHGIGADQVRGLADAGPGQLRVPHKLGGVAAGHGADAAELLLIQKAVARHIVHHGVLPQHHGDLSKGAVAGVGEGLLKGLLIMGAGAGDGDAGDVVLMVAVEGAFIDVLDLLIGRGGGDQLEDGAGDKAGGEAAVDIGPFRGRCVLIHRVKTGHRDQTQHLPGLVVAEHHHAPGLRVLGQKGLVDHLVEPSVNAQRQDAVFRLGHAGKEGEVLHPAPIPGENAGAGAAPVVPGHMVIGYSGLGVLGKILHTLAEGGQNLTVPIQQNAAGAGVYTGKVFSPVLAPVDIVHQVHAHAADDQRRDQQQGKSPVSDLPHTSPPAGKYRDCPGQCPSPAPAPRPGLLPPLPPDGLCAGQC